MSHDNRLIPGSWNDVTPGGAGSENLIGFRVGTAAGNVAVIFQNGRTHTFKSVSVDTTITGDIKQIVASGTTATGIEGARA